MQSFTSHTGILGTVDRANIDTDQIIPKQFLKSIQRTGFGESLFFDWRYLPDGKPNPDFSLNRPEFKGATILVARNNFGCGSSREHAVWALAQYGLKAILAPRRGDVPAFADIFHNNSIKNGLLAVELKDAEIEAIFEAVGRNPGLKATINLEEQRVTLQLDEEVSFHFDIDAGVKEHLVRGLDDIGLTLQKESDISAFEQKHFDQLAR